MCYFVRFIAAMMTTIVIISFILITASITITMYYYFSATTVLYCTVLYFLFTTFTKIHFNLQKQLCRFYRQHEWGRTNEMGLDGFRWV